MKNQCVETTFTRTNGFRVCISVLSVFFGQLVSTFLSNLIDDL